jgi:hypothetical protein
VLIIVVTLTSLLLWVLKVIGSLMSPKCNAEHVTKIFNAVYPQLGVNELVSLWFINALFFNSLKLYKTHSVILPNQLFGSLHLLFWYAVLLQMCRALLYLLLFTTVTWCLPYRLLYPYIKGTVEIVPAHTMKTYRGSWGIAPFILNLGTGCICVVHFMPQLL